MRVLVCEDNVVNQTVAIEILESLGCSVVVADIGRCGLEEFANTEFDLVLMDCHMPEVDGFEAARRIRRLEAQREGGTAKRVPIVALTADALEGSRKECVDSGMGRPLSKPFTSHQIAEAIQRWCSGERAESLAQIAN